jgi:hypothetical protein
VSLISAPGVKLREMLSIPGGMFAGAPASVADQLPTFSSLLT